MCVKEEASSKNRYLISAAAIKCAPLFRAAEKNNAGVQLHTKVKSSVKKKQYKMFVQLTPTGLISISSDEGKIHIFF